jgi:hypothetical protein
MYYSSSLDVIKRFWWQLQDPDFLIRSYTTIQVERSYMEVSMGWLFADYCVSFAKNLDFSVLNYDTYVHRGVRCSSDADTENEYMFKTRNLTEDTWHNLILDINAPNQKSGMKF